MPCQKKRSTRRGATLIEAIVYLAIFSFMSVVLVQFFLTITKEGQQGDASVEVQSSILQTRTALEQLIRRADRIDAEQSRFGVDPGILVLRMPNGQEDPTRIDLTEDNGRLRVRQGQQEALLLTSPHLDVRELRFLNRSGETSPQSIELGISISKGNTQADTTTTITLRK